MSHQSNLLCQTRPSKSLTLIKYAKKQQSVEALPTNKMGMQLPADCNVQACVDVCTQPAHTKFIREPQSHEVR